jgi:flagellar motor switch/type III secretory pathway protein FliN
MKSIMNEKGVLSVELGETWLSREEAVSIKAGDIVKLNSFAGDWVRINFNENFLGTGEMVILDNNWGVKINGVIEQYHKQIPRNPRDLTDRLTACVRMASLPISLNELSDLKVGSVIIWTKMSPQRMVNFLLPGFPQQ